eukprot:COSAG02_NODE_417_length_22746_cov_9.074172_16_plen_226_part_00
MLESGGEGGSSLYGINMTTRHPLFLRLARDPRITDIVACLIGENICLQHSKTVHKSTAEAGGGQVRFHQDFAYFPHTNYDVLAAMLVLDDFTEENACMRVVRGSHTLGLLDHNTTADGFFNAEPRQRELWEDDASLAKLTPSAGGLSIHHALALHGSPVNTSGKPRRGEHDPRIRSALGYHHGSARSNFLWSCARASGDTRLYFPKHPGSSSTVLSYVGCLFCRY